MALPKPSLLLDFTDSTGSFGGLDKMFRQLAMLRNLTDVKRTATLKTIFVADRETIQRATSLTCKGKDAYSAGPK